MEPTSTERLLLRWGPALALVAIAALHTVAVYGAGASRWRVGGMGMYSEPHPNDRDLIFVRGEEELSGRRLVRRCEGGEPLLRAAVTHPFRWNIEAFADACLPHPYEGWTVLVVQPLLDPESLRIRRQIVREVEL